MSWIFTQHDEPYTKANNILNILHNLTYTIHKDPDQLKANIAIKILLHELSNCDARFGPGRQMDSHDCILTLIKLLHQNVKKDVSHLKSMDIYPHERDWFVNLGYEDSIVNDLFHSQIVHTIHNKNETEKRYEVFNTFFLDIPPNTGSFSTVDALKNFQCAQQIGDITTQNEFFRIAPIIQITFMHPQGLHNTTFNLTQSFTIEGFIYDLVSFLLHIGDDANGHYIAFCQVDGKWYRYDDDRVTELSPDLLEQPFVFLPTLLFYERSYERQR